MANYLFNGVELPALPALDYPHVVIVGGMTASFRVRYSIHMTDKPLVDVAGCLCAADVYYTEYGCWEADIEGGVWTLEEEKQFGTYNAFSGAANSPKIWSNYDIMSNKGELVFAASDPIPVTAPEPLDPESMTLGWLVGRRIAGQRKRV